MKFAASLWGVVGVLGLAACGEAQKVCTPGVVQACLGSARCGGVQACLPNGMGFESCLCTLDAGQDAGAVEVDAGAVEVDGGCTTTSQCASSHVCTLGKCLEVDGGIGALCATQDQCLPGHACTAGSGIATLGTICIAPCQSSAACPGGLVCRVLTANQSLCVPANLSLVGVGCRVYQDDGTLDPIQDCREAGLFCEPASDLPLLGTCTAGSNCKFEEQTGCAVNESCRPVGTFDWENDRGTLCVPDGTGGPGAPCTSFFDCAAGLGCKLKSDGTSMCLSFCVPGSTVLTCTGVNRSLADGGTGGPTTCIDAFRQSDGGPVEGASAINSVPAGFCD